MKMTSVKQGTICSSGREKVLFFKWYCVFTLWASSTVKNLPDQKKNYPKIHKVIEQEKNNFFFQNASVVNTGVSVSHVIFLIKL